MPVSIVLCCCTGGRASSTPCCSAHSWMTFGELSGAVVGFVCGDLVQGGDGLDETVLCDWFAGGPVVPGVERVDAGLGG